MGQLPQARPYPRSRYYGFIPGNDGSGSHPHAPERDGTIATKSKIFQVIWGFVGQSRMAKRHRPADFDSIAETAPVPPLPLHPTQVPFLSARLRRHLSPPLIHIPA